MQRTALRRLPSGHELLNCQIRHDPFKRMFDITFSLTVLICLSPLYLLLFFLIKFTSDGPVFFKSRRLGRGGKVIECLKFRTMYKDAESRLSDLLASNPEMADEWNKYYKLKNDPRITPIGKMMRKTSLDELPQFINVLKGDLSVVGPRAPALIGPPESFMQEIKHIYGPSYAKILSVRPGITGIWQISGRSSIALEEKRILEASYAETRTFWQDLLVVFKTIPAVFSSKGAF